MSVEKTLHASTYYIPETKEQSWGPTVTALLAAFATDLNFLVYLLSGVSIPLIPSTTTSLAASGTLTQTHPRHEVSGDGAAVTLDSTTAIADGSSGGQVLVLVGGDASNTVTILDNSNVGLNGDITLGEDDVLALYWHATDGEWKELFRSS